MDVIGVLTFYQCHVPSSVTLSIIIPSVEIAWKSSNTTSDIQEPCGKNGFYFIFNSFVIHAFVFFVNVDIISGVFCHLYILIYWSKYITSGFFKNLQQKLCPWTGIFYARYFLYLPFWRCGYYDNFFFENGKSQKHAHVGLCTTTKFTD